MAETLKIGVLLSNTTDHKQIGLIEFTTRGVLVYHIIQKGMHVFALKPIDHLLTENIIKDPLYVKDANLSDDKSELPLGILEEEARSCADALNKSGKPLKVGNYEVRAEMVKYPEEDNQNVSHD